MSAWNSNPVVLTVAITGADVFRDNNPNIPYTTQEIADSAIGANAAGATVAHLHVREDDGTPSGRPELFVDVIERIRAETEMLTMVSTGGANDMTIEERTTGLEAKPDISGVESGSMNFGDETFITPPPAGRGIIERATAAGIALEVEAFDVGHVVSAVRWLEQGLLLPAAADQPGLRRPRRDRRLPGGARGDGAPAPPGRLLDRHLHRPPPPADARRWRCCAGRPESAPASRTSPTSARACTPPPTPRWSRWPSGSPARWVARSRPRPRPRSC